MQTSPDTKNKITVHTLAELGPLPMKVALGCSTLLLVAFVLGVMSENGMEKFAFSYLQSTFLFEHFTGRFVLCHDSTANAGRLERCITSTV